MKIYLAGSKYEKKGVDFIFENIRLRLISFYEIAENKPHMRRELDNLFGRQSDGEKQDRKVP